jgi:hypothetical protein
LHLTVRFDSAAMRLWHVRLLERLSAKPSCFVAIDARPGAGAPCPNTDLLFWIENVLPRSSTSAFGSRVELPARFASRSDDAAPADLILDLCGDVVNADRDVWVLRFDEGIGEQALLASLLAGRAPVVTVRRGDGTVAATGRLAAAGNGSISDAFESCLIRTVTLILAALDGAASTAVPALADPDRPLSSRLGRLDAAQRGAKSFGRQVTRRLYNAVYDTPHWRVGWRRMVGPDLFDLKMHPDQGWRELADDGSRFYADPFPIDYRGVVTLFVEDFSHRTQKGIISAVAFGSEGPIGVPEPVLELDYHLSYPFVFEHDGAVWLIPESCAARSIDLYRATAFPRGWIKHSTLVSDIVASDATIQKIGDRWWMFATVRDDGGEHSDTLHLWSASDFRGPWAPHARNPVLVDIASARPAGRLVERDGAILRPVQDCRNGYGNALTIARIATLDDDAFEQTIEARLQAGQQWLGSRMHTLNSAGGLEFIDGSGRSGNRLLRKFLHATPAEFRLPSTRSPS